MQGWVPGYLKKHPTHRDNHKDPVTMLPPWTDEQTTTSTISTILHETRG